MSDEMAIYQDNYDQEIQLIKANGNDENALRIRAEQHKASERDLLDYITRKSIELAGRKAAWRDMVKQLKNK